MPLWHSTECRNWKSQRWKTQGCHVETPKLRSEWPCYLVSAGLTLILSASRRGAGPGTPTFSLQGPYPACLSHPTIPMVRNPCWVIPWPHSIGVVKCIDMSNPRSYPGGRVCLSHLYETCCSRLWMSPSCWSVRALPRRCRQQTNCWQTYVQPHPPRMTPHHCCPCPERQRIRHFHRASPWKPRLCLSQPWSCAATRPTLSQAPLSPWTVVARSNWCSLPAVPNPPRSRSWRRRMKRPSSGVDGPWCARHAGTLRRVCLSELMCLLPRSSGPPQHEHYVGLSEEVCPPRCCRYGCPWRPGARAFPSILPRTPGGGVPLPSSATDRTCGCQQLAVKHATARPLCLPGHSGPQ